MPRLTDLQRVLLSTAAQRDNGAVLPLPKRLEIKPNTLTRVLKGLLKKELVQEQSATPEAVAWREDDDGQRFILVVTPAGLDAIGVVPEPSANGADGPKIKKNSRSGRQKPNTSTDGHPSQSDAVRPGTKIALLIDLLKRKEGVTIAEIVDATGWQQHSVRGAISGTLKKKLGLDVTSEPDPERGRVYRIAAQLG